MNGDGDHLVGPTDPKPASLTFDVGTEMTQRYPGSGTTSSEDKCKPALAAETQENKKLTPKADDKDFVEELYGIMENEGPGMTLPQAISKLVDMHAQTFVVTMAQSVRIRHTGNCRTVSDIENCNV